jgi:hypothetical protein
MRSGDLVQKEILQIIKDKSSDIGTHPYGIKNGTTPIG